MSDQHTPHEEGPPADSGDLVSIRLPVWWTFAGLVGGLTCGLLLAGRPALDSALAITQPLGALWLRGLQMTIIPLVAALLILGITKMAQAARAGKAARQMLLWMFGVLLASGTVTALAMPILLRIFPIPAAASGILHTGGVKVQTVPLIGDFITSLIAPNVIEAAAQTAMLPLTIFFALFALAMARIPVAQRDVLLDFFRAMANTMLIIIGWVLWIAPVGVFALALGVAARSGGGAFVTLGHYILTVATMGSFVLVGAYALAFVGGRISPLRFAKAMIPSQAVAISTQSSLASLPAMLGSANALGIRERTADFVLPLAVAIFRATSPAMNLAVVIYIATLAGVAITPSVMIAGIAVAFIISVGSVSLPGSISFVISIGPIAIAMGVPVEPLALLVAVEMLPDIMRTVANVTMNVAVTAAVDQSTRD